MQVIIKRKEFVEYKIQINGRNRQYCGTIPDCINLEDMRFLGNDPYQGYCQLFEKALRFKSDVQAFQRCADCRKSQRSR